MNIEPGTRIGADGQRHPAGQEPTDAAEYNRRLVRVQGALEDDKVPVWDEDEEAWLLGNGGGGGFPSEDDLDPADSLNDQDFATIYQDGELRKASLGEVLASDVPGGTPLRSELAREVGDLLAKARTEVVNVVWFGDSIPLLGTMADRVANQLAPFAGHGRAGAMRHMNTSVPGAVSSAQGTANPNSVAGYGKTMAPGQKATYAFTGTGVSIVYQSAVESGRQITVRNGVGGSTIGTISPGGAPSVTSGHVWTSAPITRGPLVIEIENTGTGNVVVDGMLPHNGNIAHGLRFFPACRSGASVADFLTYPQHGLDLVENVVPDLVFINLGTNHSGGPHAPDIEALCDEILARSPDCKIVGVVPYVNGAFLLSEGAEIAAAYRTIPECVGVVDLTQLIPSPIDQGIVAGDNIHPTSRLNQAQAAAIVASVLGDKALGTGLSKLDSSYDATFDANLGVTGNLAVTGMVGVSTDPGGTGTIRVGPETFLASGNTTLTAITGISIITGQPPDVDIEAGSLEAVQAAKGLVLRSPNGKRWRLTVDNDGTLVGPTEIT